LSDLNWLESETNLLVWIFTNFF